MTLRTLLAMGLCATAAALPIDAASARDLTVATMPGALADAQQQIDFTPFTEASQVPLHQETWPGGIGPLRAQVAAGSNEWDLVQVGSEDLLAGCDEGLFEKPNWTALGGKDHYLPQAVSDCGVGSALYNTVLAWDRDKFAATPNWADFWDVAKYPGKRGLRRTARTNLEIALMADGVAPGDVYRTLRTDDGVDRAFRKLDQIKPYLVWWQSAAQAPQILGSGEVLLSTAPNPRITAANRAGRHFGMQWAGSLYTVDSWVVMKGSPNAADAAKLLVFMADPARQAALTASTAYGGVVKGANDGLTPDQLLASPSNPANLNVSLQIDDQFWRDNGDKLSQRFEAWLAR